MTSWNVSKSSVQVNLLSSDPMFASRYQRMNRKSNLHLVLAVSTVHACFDTFQRGPQKDLQRLHFSDDQLRWPKEMGDGV
jgi:hypothetical protein